mmetsp:Transcript_1730/g.2330  ORF Transcript_1730/g.2330 Transcript_1730/m.2330 type:complete len:84 (-) Transcript_1730:282-533(-)
MLLAQIMDFVMKRQGTVTASLDGLVLMGMEEKDNMVTVDGESISKAMSNQKLREHQTYVLPFMFILDDVTVNIFGRNLKVHDF